MEEIIGFIFSELIFSCIGWICLFIWYRDREKVRKARDEKYGGAFSSAGGILLLNFIAGLGALVMFGIAIFGLAAWVYKSIAD